MLLVVAVSGGPDSLCLLHLLWRLQQTGGPALHVAHLDHGLRGSQAAAEAAFVAQTAHDWGVPATVEHQDVGGLIQQTGQNVQATARAARYTFLARVAQAVRADAVAVAHQADDQAETVLLHLLHGAGPAGLRGMRAVVPWLEWGAGVRSWETGNGSWELDSNQDATHPPLVRPLLTTRREAIEAYCTAWQLTPQHDPSNTAPRYARSRIRAELLPAMTDYNQHIVAALERTAQICADDYAYLQTQLDILWPELAREAPEVISFDLERWQQVPTALQRYALRRAAQHLVGSDGLSYEHVEAARAAAAKGPGTQQTLGQGLILRVEYGSVLLINTRAQGSPEASALHQDTYPQLDIAERELTLPGITPISDIWAIVATCAEPSVPAEPRWQVLLDQTTITAPLVVRRRQPGERFRPAGGRGSRRLQDWFIDQKVPRSARAAWPLVSTTTAVVWVVGLRPDARFAAMDLPRHPLWLTLTRTATNTLMQGKATNEGASGCTQTLTTS